MLRSIVSRVPMFRVRVSGTAVGAAVVMLAVGCGSGETAERPLTDLPLTVEQLPAGFSAAPMQLDDLIGANRRALEASRTVRFSPAVCAPTADAAFNPRLTEDNSVLVVGRSDDATLSELVSTVRRDIDADRRATTGPCAVVTAVPSTGTLAGASVVTTTTELAAPRDPAVEQAYVTRSESTTTLPDGRLRARTGLMGVALVRRPNGETVTVQLGLAGTERGVSAQERQAPAPVADGDFVRLMDDAVSRAAG
ncbi:MULTISPECIES: hypothetical protein [Gordonia]|uniref:hypothetical protein n=1 Tax=Gordonia TaxID=2053 RepID=UPI0032677EC7